MLSIQLTTREERIGNLATMQKRRPKPSGAALVEIYAKRQPNRPHYLGDLMEAHGVTRAELIEAIGVDKGLLSRWLDDRKPSTPSYAHAQALGRFFAPSPDPEDFVDIFTDPAVAWFQKFTRGRAPDELERIKATLEMAFPAKRTG